MGKKKGAIISGRLPDIVTIGGRQFIVEVRPVRWYDKFYKFRERVGKHLKDYKIIARVFVGEKGELFWNLRREGK